ncbi:hypothetical protein C8Q73DRAFT_790447 [Cubamyces lactineus]|nr:hypothetical protein C8Q73DRAFT_790447 [Cubamyces lactineus]
MTVAYVNDVHGNNVKESDAPIDLTRYREEETGDDYSDEYILDEDLNRPGEHEAQSSTATDSQPNDVAMSDTSNAAPSAHQPPPAFFAVDNNDDNAEIDDELKADLLEYINSPSPDDDGPLPIPVVLKPRWCAPGPSPLFQGYVADHPTTNASYDYPMLYETAKEDADNSSPSSVLSHHKRVLKKAIRRFKTDDTGLCKNLHHIRTCVWLCNLPYDSREREPSPKAHRLLQNRLNQFHRGGRTRVLRMYNDKAPLAMKGTPAQDSGPRGQLYIHDRKYQYRPVFDARGDPIDFADVSDNYPPDGPFALLVGRILQVTFSRPTIEGKDMEGDDEDEDGDERLQIYVYPDEAAVSFWLRSAKPYVKQTRQPKSRKHRKSRS